MLRLSMKQVRMFGFSAALATLAGAALTGCSPAQSQTAAPNTAVATTQSTNSAMQDFQKPSADELKKKLTPMQFEVTQHADTEPPFRNEFWNNHKPGLYVDIVSGKPLFSSLDKFDSGCGWPSFSKPLADKEVVEHNDVTHGMVRTEVRSQTADSAVPLGFMCAVTFSAGYLKVFSSDPTVSFWSGARSLLDPASTVADPT